MRITQNIMQHSLAQVDWILIDIFFVISLFILFIYYLFQ